MNFFFLGSQTLGANREEEKGEAGAGEVQGVHTQEWVHACGLFARNNLIDVISITLFKSPDGHDGHGMGLDSSQDPLRSHIEMK